MAAASLDNLYPYVVPAGYVDWVEPGMWVHDRISEDVQVVLAFEEGSMVRNALPSTLEEMGLSEDEAFGCACENLVSAFQSGRFQLGLLTLNDDVQVGIAQGSWMAPAGGLMIRNHYENLAAHFGVAQFAAIALNQETLVAFPTDERTIASEMLRQFVEVEHRNHRKPISRSWMLLDGAWPRAYPGIRAF